MASEPSIALRLHRVRQLPYGPARTAAAESLARQVEQHGPAELQAESLLDLVEAYTFEGDSSRAFVPFSKALRLWDTKPELFDESDLHTLFWQFKWMTSSALSHPQISAAQMDALLDDMERRYQLSGRTLDPIHKARLTWAAQRGEGVDEAWKRWLTATSDTTSDCPACDIGTQTVLHLERGEYEEAAQMGRSQRSECNREPASTFFALALAELHRGDARGAVVALGRARACSGRASADAEAESRGCEFETLARGGRLDVALRRLEREFSTMLTDDTDPLAHLVFLLCVLRGLAAADADDRPVSGLPAGVGGVTDVGGLRRWAHRQAEQLAARFDARNGTDRFARELAESSSATRLADDLPLDLDVEKGLREVPEAAGVSAPERGGESKIPDGDVDADTPADERARRAEEQGLLVEAGTYWAEAARRARADEDVDAAHETFRRSYALLRAASAHPVVRARTLESWAPVAFEVGASEEYLASSQTEIEAATAHVASLVSGDASDGRDQDDADPEVLRVALTVCAVMKDSAARVLASLEERGGVAPSTARGDDDAVRLASEAATAFEQVGLLSDAAHAGWVAARVLASRGHHAEAIALYRDVVGAFTVVRAGDERAKAAGELITLLRTMGDTAAADAVIAELTV